MLTAGAIVINSLLAVILNALNEHLPDWLNWIKGPPGWAIAVCLLAGAVVLDWRGRHIVAPLEPGTKPPHLPPPINTARQVMLQATEIGADGTQRQLVFYDRTLSKVYLNEGGNGSRN